MSRFVLACCIALSAWGCRSDDIVGAPRVFRLGTAADGITGTDSGGRAGDWIIQNDEVRFVVQDALSGAGFSMFGGSLVDFDRGRAGDDRLQELFAQCDLRVLAPSRAELVNEGREGAPAILRMVGEDRGIPLIDSILRSEPLGVEMSIEYILPPTGSTLEIVVRAKDVRREGSREIGCGLVLVRGDRFDGFLDGEGFETASADSEIPYFAAGAADAKSSFVLYRPAGPLSPVAVQADITPLATETRNLPTAGTREERFFLSIGTGDIESALQERRRVLADALPRAEVEVHFGLPEALGSIRDEGVVEVLDSSRSAGNQSVTSFRVPAAGSASVRLPPGTYDLKATLRGLRAGSATVEVLDTSTSVDIPARELGLVRVRAQRLSLSADVEGPTPAHVFLLRGHGALLSGEVVDEKYLAYDEAFLAPPGEYTAVIAQGPEFDVVSRSLTVRSGEESVVEGNVRRVVDSAGYVAADFHVHGARSMDADADLRLRVLAAVSEGLDVLLATDHDVVSDYFPVAESLGLRDAVTTVSGIEESPLWGHINGFPLTAEQPIRYFSLPWFRYENGKYQGMLEPHEVTQKLYDAGAEIVQINHPRSGQGVFGYVRLDPSTGQSEKTWPKADAFEILNGKRVSDFNQVFPDMIALARAGRRLTATGVSDAHGAYSGLGYARTYVKASGQAGAVQIQEVWESLRTQRAIASLGPFLTLRAESPDGAADIGGAIHTTARAITLSVKVEAPAWLSLDEVTIFREDVPIVTLPVSTATVAIPAVRLEATVTATVAGPTFFLAVAKGTQSSPPVLREPSLAITNPIFVSPP